MNQQTIQELSSAGCHQECLQACQQLLQNDPDNPSPWKYAGKSLLAIGQFEKAEQCLIKAHQLDNKDHEIIKDIGNIFNALQNDAEAIRLYKAALSIDQNYAPAINNLGLIAKRQGNLAAAEELVKRACDLDQSFAPYHSNLGGIYKDLGNLDQALASTLKSLELKGDNPGAVNNLRAFIEQLSLSQTNAKNLTQAYELLLNQTYISHRKLTPIFLQAFLPTIQKAAASDPIISESNEAFKALASDWRFLKSLALIVPASSEAEVFFTRLRNEILNLTFQEIEIPKQVKSLTEALAAQCFLNEYVYTSSQEEDESIAQLIKLSAQSQESSNRYLAIIGCYKAIYTTGISPKFIKNYPIHDYSSKDLITTQFKEPRQEQEIKTSFQEKQNIVDTTSQKVQEMYEENPYPRFKYADYTKSDLANPIHKAIEIETTRKRLSFSDELLTSSVSPKALIAGCGTGNQVIVASRYKNAEITAIDLSSSSLAYAIRKSMEYGMNNVTFKQMDLLNVAQLGDIFDIIECSGVLHHMEEPSKGLCALIQQLKPGGYIKLGLYSEIARKVIVEARETIQTAGINSTPESIRKFREKVIKGEIKELLDLPKFGKDFYSLSECRDLCFHVQEHRFTTESLQKLLDSHGLTFCGFMVSDQIKKLYQEIYPEDHDMTSLSNWGEFEEEHPSTFAGMYQFWAQK